MSESPATEPTLDPDILSRWIGKQQTVTDTIRPEPVAFMRATLDQAEESPKAGDPLPHAWHWLYFLEAAPISQLGRDGHAARGEFLPPVALPRRMWAGGRLEFIEPILIGEQISKQSTIKAITQKSGRSGELCFVTVRHEFTGGSTLKMTEEHDIVYRQDPTGNVPSPALPAAPRDALESRTVNASSVMLFRYSALTFNSHRIHYDLDYCRNVEGLPGLIVHGPLTATLLVGLAGEHCGTSALGGFEFRAVSPLYSDQPFSISVQRKDQKIKLWATNSKGGLAMTATASS